MSGPGVNWYALFVRSNHEFVTSDQLQRRGVEVFLPSIMRTRRWSDREKCIRQPLFPGYVFVHVSPGAEVFLRILKAYGAISFVTQEPGHPAAIDPQELQSLRSMLDAGCKLDVYPGLSVGSRVIVKRGPLQGVEGVLLQKDADHLFLVNINILGRSVGTRINADDLEILSTPRQMTARSTSAAQNGCRNTDGTAV